MLFYADKLRRVQAEETVSRVAETLRRSALLYRSPTPLLDATLESHSEIVGASIALGELHQAVADRLNEERDDVHPQLEALAEAGVMVGRCIYRSAALLSTEYKQDVGAGVSAGPPDGRGVAVRIVMASLLDEAARSVACAAQGLPSETLEARVPEGYAFYCLYPEMYLASVGRAVAEWLIPAAAEPPCTVIGIRSIGTSLAGLVAGALIEMGLPARVETLRPRGHPFDRYVDLGQQMRDRLVAAATEGSAFFVVDEGPGLTCSSFLSVCTALARLGVDEERIAILSAWRGAPSIYASDEGRRRWAALRVYHTDAVGALDGWGRLLPFVDAALARADPSLVDHRDRSALPEIFDLSYGRWREHLYSSPDPWPAVHRSTERVKLLLRYAAGEAVGAAPPGRPPEAEATTERFRVLAKFAGLGDYGREKQLKAVALANAGFAPQPLGIAYGFLLYRFEPDARPLELSDLSPAVLQRMVSYYSFVARTFPAPATPRFQSLAELILVNVREALGIDAGQYLEAWQPYQETIDRLPLVLIDGKPQPHEWLQVKSQAGTVVLKTDGDDHFRDHTLVGEQSILWDLAGASEEWEMEGPTRAAFLTLWERDTGDSRAALLLDFYRTAYLAFRVAALHYAIHSTDEEEVRLSLQHQQWKYQQRLTQLLAPRQSNTRQGVEP